MPSGRQKIFKKWCWMHSKYLPWDFVRKYPEFIESGRVGIYSFYTFDSFLEKVLLDKIPGELFEGGKLKVLLGNELTVEWLEENFQMLGLFAANESFLVLNAENIPMAARDKMLDCIPNLENRYLFFSFSKKVKFFEQLSKKKEVMSYEIVSPPFWDMSKLFSFFASQFEINVSYDVKNYILASLPATCGNFVLCLNIIKLHFVGQNEVALSKVKELITPSKIDHFLLASIYGMRERAHFFKKLFEVGIDFDALQSFFSFMQTHLLKLSDVSYCQKKSRMSKYDNEIITQAKLWESDEIKRDLRMFAELQIMTKNKNIMIVDRIRSEYLKTL